MAFIPRINPGSTINGVTTTYCYDYADRLVSSSDATANNPTYDSRGNTTSTGTGSKPLSLCYDSSNRNWCLTQYDSSGTGQANYSSRDVTGRTVYREQNTVTNWTWSLSGQQWYGFTGGGDSPDFTRNAAWVITEQYLQLPGGVMLSIKPQQTGNNQKQYSASGTLGHTLLTTDAAGTNTATGNGPAGTFTYDPFGNPLPGSVLPANTTSGSYGYGGARQKLTETTLDLTPIQMGARVYLPTLGRFTSPDPIDGGTPNRYVYVVDPLNGNDYSGLLGVINSSSSFIISGVVNADGYSMQPHAATPAPKANTHIQPTLSAAKTQGPGSFVDPKGKPSFSAGLPVKPFISRVEWEGEDRLRVYPTLRGRTIGTLPMSRKTAWREVVMLAPGADTKAMEDQFLCHLDFVPFKSSWNLDLSRPDVGYWSTAKEWCNP